MKITTLILVCTSLLLCGCKDAAERFWWPFGGPPQINPFAEKPPQGDAYSISGSPGSGS